MNNDELNNETDDLFRKGLENLSEKRAPEQEWQKMKSHMEKERLLAGKTNMRRLFTLLLLTFIAAGTASVYFLNKDSFPDKNVSLKTNESELIKDESVANKHRITTLPPSPQATDAGDEIESKPATEISDADKITISTKKPTIAEHQKSKEAAITAGNAKAIKLKKEKAADVATSRQRAKHKASSSPPKKDKSSTINERDESSNGENTGEGSSAKKTPQESNSYHAPDTKEGQPDSISAIKNQNDTVASGNSAGGIKAVDTSVVKSTNALLPQDSSQISTDAVPVIEKKTNPGRSRVHIGGYFSLDFNHYLVKESNAVPASEANYVSASDSINGINSIAQFTAGITVAYMIDDHFEIEGGASYSKKKEVRANVNAPAYINDSAQQAYSEYIYNYNADYFELSGKVKYYYPLGNKKWLYAGVGGIVSFNFPENQSNLGYYTHITFSDSVWVKSDKVTLQPASAIFTALVVAGFETELNDKLSFFIGPEYKYGFDPVINHPTFNYIPVNHYWRTFSIALGLKYSL